MEGITNAQFGLLIALFSVIALAFILSFGLGFKYKNISKIIRLIGLLCSGILFIALIVVSYTNPDYPYKIELQGLWNNFGLYILTVALVLLIAIVALICGKKKEVNETKSIAYAAVCLATSFALSYVRIFHMPQGGSVTLASLIPIMLYSYMFGVRRGVVIGTIYGLLQFIQEPYFYHPMEFLLDYPIAFGAIGLTGLFNELNILGDKPITEDSTKIKTQVTWRKPLQFAICATIAVTLRYFSHVIAGAYFFGEWRETGYSVIGWSFAYNAFAFVDLVFDIIVGVALFTSRSMNRLLERAVQ